MVRYSTVPYSREYGTVQVSIVIFWHLLEIKKSLPGATVQISEIQCSLHLSRLRMYICTYITIFIRAENATNDIVMT